MSVHSLPARPDLDQLRRRAKELRSAAREGVPDALARFAAHRPAGAPVTLAAAQLVVAREHGFASWPQLKAAVEEHRMSREQKARALVVASVSGRMDRARRLVDADPSLATDDVWTAAALGEAAHVRALLARDPTSAIEPDPESGWTPLLVACNSRWHVIDPGRGAGLREVAELLLDAGASPDTSVGRVPELGHCSALYAAAGLANHPQLAGLLLTRGADPDTPAALYHTAFLRDHVCLRLLLDHGARAEGADALAAAISVDDAEAVRLLLDAGVDAAVRLPAQALGESYAPEPAIGAVRAAVELQCGIELVALLLERGADPDAPGQDGQSAFRLAVRQGRTEVVDLLRAHGARDDATDVDRFLDACVRADRPAAEQHLARCPGLLGGLTELDHRAIAHAADHGDLPAVALMLDLGFPLDAPVGDDGASPLHAAAGAGAAELVAFLIGRGAGIEAKDTTWAATPLCWATVGSGLGLGHHPRADWVSTVQTLITAGASTQGVWVAGKPPSDEVAAVLATHGVRPPVDDDDDEDQG
ncbi:MAG TPA: ankyrin repeat domain-containing protein [Acidimicrobiales bacterium]|nr:ankyrin repeat domain-containing protein [Acidimicrobiales bacterium]